MTKSLELAFSFQIDGQADRYGDITWSVSYLEVFPITIHTAEQPNIRLQKAAFGTILRYGLMETQLLVVDQIEHAPNGPIFRGPALTGDRASVSGLALRLGPATQAEWDAALAAWQAAPDEPDISHDVDDA